MPLRLFFCTLALLLFATGARAQSAWQQSVAYDMDVTLLADRHQMRGTQRLEYTNNSPDTLRQVFYHLYFNAFDPQSMMAERNRVLPDPDSRVVPRIFNLGPDEVGFHEILSLEQDGAPVSFERTDTVVRVDLAEPILPGETAVFEMTFRSQVPLQTRRSGRDSREGIDFSMSQWYPKLAMYDEEGWHADPYIGREFYAPFGTFDVQITAPAKYVIGATGVLQNASEVGHGYEQPGTWTPEDASFAEGDSLTWHFVAENVHDFAWAADPDYIHEYFVQDGTDYHLLYQPGVADRWAPMSDWVPDLIGFFSDEYGPYAYPQFTVTQAGDGGMEYPMINFLTGRRSPASLLGVTAHEAAHEWFYAMLGMNEAEYSWIDEGFTSYATDEGVAHVMGTQPASHLGAYLSVLNLRRLGLLETFNTPADWFSTNAAYGTASYPGGEMIVDMLGYVISDPLRDAWLKALYDRYLFDHVDPQDLEKTAEDVSGLRLDWYFEQFADMNRPYDYALTDLDARQDGNGYTATVTLERKAEVAMPADVRLTLADGSEQWVNVPLGIMQGHKSVPEGWTVTEPWPWTSPEYTFTVSDLPARPVKAEVDPLGKTPDVNRLNNTSGFPLEARFLQPPGQSWFDYRVGYRPLAQYAHDFGPGVGAQARGQYLFGQHRFAATLKLWPQVLFSGGEEPEIVGIEDNPFSFCVDECPEVDLETSWFDGLDYGLEYALDVDALGPRAELLFDFQKRQGFLENRITLRQPLDAYGSDAAQGLTLGLLHQLNPTDRVFRADYSAIPEDLVLDNPPDVVPLALGQLYNPFRREHMISARLGYAIEDGPDYVRVAGEVGTSVRSRSESDFEPPEQNATKIMLGAQKSLPLGPLAGRAALAVGIGNDGLAFHKQFRLGGASVEEAWRSDAFRTASSAFADPVEDAHLVPFADAGPVAYLNAERLRPTADRFTGDRLLAGRLTLSTGALAENRWLRPLRFDAFSGIGRVWREDRFEFLDVDEFVADAGLGLRYDVSSVGALSRWTGQSDVLQGLYLTAKFPLWASDPDFIERGQDELAFRWLLGLTVRP